MRLSGILIVTILAMLYIGISIVIALLGTSNVHIPNIDAISVVSMMLFVGLCALGTLNERFYLTILIFIIIGFPTAVNNFIPGIYNGEVTEIGASIFPFFTHLDIYLLVGIFRYSKNTLNENYRAIAWPVAIVVVLLFTSFFVNVFYSKNMYEAELLLIGAFQLRYLILLYFILLLIKEQRLKFIAAGIAVSLFFLFIESTVFTIMNGYERLESGSLATNTFGNIVAQLGMFLFFYCRKYPPFSKFRLFLLAGAITGLLMAVLTGTRMSIISAVLVYLIVWAYRRFTFAHVARLAIGGAVIIVAIVSFNLHNKLPDKFKVWQFLDTHTVTTVFSEDFASYTAIPITRENSSIITRLQLFRTSGRMIVEDPVLGIGAGRWNYYKTRFGYDFPYMLDSHNGYLATLSQYGLFAGVALIVFILLAPSLIFLRHVTKFDKIHQAGIWQLGVVSMGMTICEFSNAGVFKPQVYAMLIFIALILVAHNREKSDALPTASGQDAESTPEGGSRGHQL